VKISINWIRDFVPLPTLNPQEISNRITLSTAEVEGVEEIGKQFAQVLTARVLEVKPHPNAEKLRLVRVHDGMGEMEVVCGAPNVAVGQIVALAKAGAVLPTGELKAAVIRGVRSEGMILAEDELGVSSNHDGIMVFSSETAVGQTLDKLFGAPDIVLEIDNKSLTHRPDLWGHVGFAREFAAITHRPHHFRTDTSQITPPAEPDPLVVENRTPELCPRYSALVVRNVRVLPSPLWLQQRLRAVGLRPINNLVDVTNYVMLEVGEPLHAFDRRQILGDKIVIRRAEPGEHFITLDEREHELISDDILIADGERAVALAGVMGGMNSAVADDTTCVVLEAANFHPAHIRRTAGRLNLRTDSSQRFEKSLDPANTIPALIRAFELLKLTCPEAEPGSVLLDSWPNPPKPIDIVIDFEHIHSRLGERLPEERIIDILKSLQFGVRRLSDQGLEIRVPTWRATKDISMKADIVEEIGRIFGYDNITPRAPLVLSDPPPINFQRRFEWKIRDLFCGQLHFDEVTNYSFTSEAVMLRCGLDPEPALRLKNPLSKEMDRMRTSLVPSVLTNIELNQKNLAQFRLFEIGRTTLKDNRKDPTLAKENRRICGALYGGEEMSFFTAKGVVEEFLQQIGIADWSLDAKSSLPAWAHPGRGVVLRAHGQELGVVAELHPRVADSFELKQRVAIFDMDLDIMFTMPKIKKSFTPLRRFPVNPIEITVVMDERRPVSEVENVIRAAGGDFLVGFEFLYIYQGERLPVGQKAVTYHVDFGAPDRTLTREETATLHSKLTQTLRDNGMPLRGEEG